MDLGEYIDTVEVEPGEDEAAVALPEEEVAEPAKEPAPAERDAEELVPA